MYILYVLSLLFFFFFFLIFLYFNIFIFYSVDIVDDNVNIVDEEPHFVGYSAINHYYYYYYYAIGERACFALPSNRQPKIQLVVAAFAAGEFHWQSVLSDITGSSSQRAAYFICSFVQMVVKPILLFSNLVV